MCHYLPSILLNILVTPTSADLFFSGGPHPFLLPPCGATVRPTVLFSQPQQFLLCGLFRYFYGTLKDIVCSGPPLAASRRDPLGQIHSFKRSFSFPRLCEFIVNPHVFPAILVISIPCLLTPSPGRNSRRPRLFLSKLFTCFTIFHLPFPLVRFHLTLTLLRADIFFFPSSLWHIHTRLSPVKLFRPVFFVGLFTPPPSTLIAQFLSLFKQNPWSPLLSPGAPPFGPRIFGNSTG